MSPSRLFAAVELPAGVRRELDARAMDLLLRPAPGTRPKSVRGLSMVPPENLHITVRFLGDVPEERVPGISEALRAAAASVAPGTAVLQDDGQLQGFGAFPSERRPSVVWCGVRCSATGAGVLENLERACSALLAPLGLPPEQRAYHPHVTVARVREARTRRVIAERLAASRPPRAGDGAGDGAGNGEGGSDAGVGQDSSGARPPSDAPAATIPVERLTLFRSSARRPDATETGRDPASRATGVHYEVLAHYPLGSDLPGTSGNAAS